MILSLLLAAAAPANAVEAERAFAAMAQSQGQWTAFRAFAAEDGVMFLPQPVEAQVFLKDRKDPPVALKWGPTRSWTSCDRKTAYNTGPWTTPDGKAFGYFSTLWQKQADGGWKWRVDHGDALGTPLPGSASVDIKQASCKGAPQPNPAALPAGQTQGNFLVSADRSLTVTWAAYADNSSRLVLQLWDGTRYTTAFESRIAPPKP